MHFKTVVLAGLSSLAAAAALPSSGSHDSHMLPRHHRYVRRRTVEPAPCEVKRCASSSSSSAEPAPEPTAPVYAGNARANSSSTSTSTGKSTVPTTGTGGISIGDKLVALFPAGTKSTGSKWSTNPAFSGAIALSDDALRATKMIARLSHPVVEMQGKKAMKISFPAGSYAFRSSPVGGVSFYALGPLNQPITNAKVLTFSFSVLFDKDFDFKRGGKLPGLYGGTSDDEATGCSGGRRSDKCWSTRVMWRTKGAAELYTYLPPSAQAQNKKAVCSPGNISCDGDYGWSLGRGTWSWKTSAWQTMAQKVTLNDPGKNNGQVVIYLDGKEVYSANNIVLRMSANSVPRGAMVQSFFGGHDKTWASPKDQNAYFADFSMAVLE